jgi:hypothetical protein
MSSPASCPESTKDELLRRAKLAAVRHGRVIGGSKDRGQPRHVVNELPIYSLKLELPDADVTIIWIAGNKNLRIRASVISMGHWGSKSIVDEHEGKRPPEWHYEALNMPIVYELRRLMVLDDLADV